MLIGVRLQPDLLARLDKVIKPGQTRPQAIREILEKELP
jgi:metal-responsive CopG/Arc/MetJ family transcriptional regulator